MGLFSNIWLENISVFMKVYWQHFIGNILIITFILFLKHKYNYKVIYDDNIKVYFTNCWPYSITSATGLKINKYIQAFNMLLMSKCQIYNRL